MKIAVLADYTIRGIENKEHEWKIFEYDMSVIWDKSSNLYSFQPDVILVSILFSPAFSFIEELKQKFEIVFVHNIPYFPPKINQYSSRWKTNRDLDLLDVKIINLDSLVSEYGADKVFDERIHNITGGIFSSYGMKLVQNQFVRVLKSIDRVRKKCLVVDLDNTLWSGSIEEGIEITKSHKLFQKQILNWVDSGIILCVCSKNDESILDVFEKHTDMIIKKHNLATWRINWLNKSDNISQIASELNIGLDSIVFLDDSEYEIDEVNKRLPEVTAFQMPKDFAEFPKLAASIEEFDSFYVTETDVKRNEMYVSERERKASQGSMSYEEFLHSLKIFVSIEKADNLSLPRIVEMSQRTNQFNLNGRKFSLPELRKLDCYIVKSKDKFGDQGIVASCVKNGPETIGIYVSCRILGKGIEQVVLTNFDRFTSIDTGKNKAFLDFVGKFEAGIPKWIALSM